MLSEGERAEKWEAAAPCFFGKLVTRGIRGRGTMFTHSLGVVFSDFHPSFTFLSGLGIFVLIGKESTCNAGDLGWIPGLGRWLEKGKATHSSILAWGIPWTTVGEGGGWQRVGYNWETFTYLLIEVSWRPCTRVLLTCKASFIVIRV